jgi:poly(3-hydroxybutyrate) depolymerase
VSFKIPASLANSKKPPLVIVVHGGGGRADAETITELFLKTEWLL